MSVETSGSDATGRLMLGLVRMPDDDRLVTQSGFGLASISNDLGAITIDAKETKTDARQWLVSLMARLLELHRVLPLLPVRFGAWVDQGLVQSMGGDEKILLERIDMLSGHCEMTVVVTGMDAAPGEISQKGGDYLRQLAGHVLPEQMVRIPALVSLHGALLSLARSGYGLCQPMGYADQSGGKLAAQLGPVGMMTYLVPFDAVDAAREIIETAAGRIEAPMSLALSGPWPPYRFANRV